MPQYKGDPRQTVSKFPSTCPKCNNPIKKGEDIIYWPSSKEAMHYECGQPDYQAFLESAQDEDQYNHQ